MRYFWSLLAALVVITGVLNITRRGGEADQSSVAPSAASSAAQAAAPSFGRPAERSAPAAGALPEPASAPASEPEPQAAPPVVLEEAPDVSNTLTEHAELPVAAEITEEQTTDRGPQDEPVAAADPDASLDTLLGVVEEAEEVLPGNDVVEAAVDPAARDAAPPEPDVASEPAIADEEAQTGTVGPAYSFRADGSLEVEGAGVIIGDGSPQRPYVLDWQVLRSIARDYNPKRGQEQLPEWLNELDGKAVRVEGNTLLPVVAAAVDELLVMQNPWDGCCIGIPPTPYDAIEVKLAELTRMGSTTLGHSPTGFGTVEGTFKIDPYIVQGWLLGLYLIEDASFESAAGMELPGF